MRQVYGPLGLRVVFISQSDSKERQDTMGDNLALFKTLRPHHRMNFLVISGLPSTSDQREQESMRHRWLDGELCNFTHCVNAYIKSR